MKCNLLDESFKNGKNSVLAANGQTSLLFGQLYDIYNEDGSRRYYSGNSSNFGQQAFDQMNGVFLSSCVGYNIREEDKKVEEYLIVGTSLGEIYKFSITKNNSVIQENKYKYIED